MSAKYILRFDDLNPFQNKDKWNEIETFLIDRNIKPIIAVVPDNKDTALCFDEYDTEFWNNIKRLQSLGWSIALHGYQHVLKKCCNSVVKTNNYGALCDNSYEEQNRSIRSGLLIFKENNISTNIYCAPAHSFDENTLKALSVNGINTITDGFFLRNGYCKKYHFDFIPQQLWRFRKMPFGIFTICYHHNSMSSADIDKFKRDVECNIDNIIGVNDLKERDLSFFDYLFASLWCFLLKIKKYA